MWARQSINMGLESGYGKEVNRIGFRHPAGQYEGPYDIIRWAAKRLGNNKLEIQALNKVNKIMDNRLNLG